MTTQSLPAAPSLKQSPPAPSCPYRGLDPFTESDQKYFFGRKEETVTLAANALTAPMTILYGPSGVGKSSLVMAGLVPELRKYPETIVVLFRTWREPDLIRALNERLAEAVRRTADVVIDTSERFDECAKKVAAQTRATIVVVFDQFEELFLYHPAGSRSGDEFDVQFARTANRRESGFNFLLSLREDWMAKLDRFQRNIPNLLSNYIRLDHLDEKGARMAIEEPLKAWNAEAGAAGGSGMGLDPELVPALIDEVKTGNETLGTVTHDENVRVETPFLQMILLRLWEAEHAVNSSVMRLDTFRHLGGAKKIVHAYVDDTMRALSSSQQETAASLFDRLVTPSGCKIALFAGDLQDFAGKRAAEVPELLQTLAAKSILRLIGKHSEPQYEIFHDVLAQPILAWRSKVLTKKKVRRSLRLRAAAVVAAIVLAGEGWNVVRAHTHVVELREGDRLLADARHDVEQDPIQAAMKLTSALRFYDSSKGEEGKLAVAVVAASMIESSRVRVLHQQYQQAIPYAQAAHDVAAMLRDSFITLRSSRILAFCASKTNRPVLFQRSMGQLTEEMKRVMPGPALADAHMRNGRLYTALQRPSEALAEFNLALRQCERKDAARIAEILYYRSSVQDKNIAIQSLQRALPDVGPDLRLNVLHSLESYSHDLGREDDARRYRQQIELPPKRSPVAE
jgi:tetratricopeptide (TPR) repeat protein